MNLTPHQLIHFIRDYFGSSEFTEEEVRIAWGKYPNKRYYTAGFWLCGSIIREALKLMEGEYSVTYKSLNSKTVKHYKSEI